MRILCFEIEFVGFKNSWQKIAMGGKGNKIDAIKKIKEKYPKMSLKEAKDRVEEYMIKKGVHYFFEDGK